MAPLPSRKELEAMKRIDIQNLCKEYGVRANLKTEKLIDLLIETQSAPSPAPSVQTRRSMSATRKSSRGAGPSRTASIIINDMEEGECAMDTIQEEPEVEDYKSNLPQPVRTRKAKDLQTKLGVGRPTAAGGSGARAVTKATSVPRGRRGRSYQAMSGVDAAISEDADPSPSEPIRSQSERPVEPSTLHLPALRASSTPPFDVQRQISDALLPLQLKVEGLEEELRNSRRRNEELERIQAQLADVATLQQRYDSLEAEVRELRSENASIASLSEEFRLLKASLTSHSSPIALPTTPKHRSPPFPHDGLGLGFPSAFKAMGFHHSLQTSTPTEAVMRDRSPAPQGVGASSTTLGKRARSVSPSSGEDNLEACTKEDENAFHEGGQSGIRPEKKRAKLDNGTQRPMPIAGPSKPRVPTSEVAAQLLAPRMPTFAVFQTREAHVSTPYARSTPPPIHSLPEVYRPSSPPGAPLLPPARTGPSRATSSATNAENQRHNFDLSIFGANSGNDSFLQPIPFPDAPQSPTPAGHITGFMNQQDPDRTDPFKEFGFPSPRRPTRIASGNTERTLGAGKEPTVSNQVAAGLGLTMVRTGTPAIVDSTPSRKTLYGTELEGDSRFGDFGVEGIGSGFWTR